MLRPTIYIAPKDLCQLTVRWRAAEAAAEAIRADQKATTNSESRPSPRTPEGPLAAV